MSVFVGECRSEWKRLGVPDLVADEMAAELAADLEEAEAEGASTVEVLGAGAFDPAAFAAAWAAERGVIGRARPNGQRLRRSWPMPGAILASTLIAVVGAVLVIVVSPSAPHRQTSPTPAVLGALEVVSTPDGQTIAALSPSAGAQAAAQAAAAQAAAALSPSAAAQAAAQAAAARDAAAQALWVAREDATTILEGERGGSGDNTRTVGSVLLSIALLGIVLTTLSWWWVDPRRR